MDTLDEFKFAYENKVLPDEVKGKVINRFRAPPCDYDLKLNMFLWRAPRVIKTYESIARIEEARVHRLTLSMDVISYDLEWPLIVPPDTPDLIDLFSLCACTNYVPHIQYRDMIKCRGRACDAEFATHEAVPQSIRLTLYRYTYMSDSVPYAVDDEMRPVYEIGGAGRAHRGDTIVTLIEIVKQAAGLFIVKIKKVSNYLKSVYKNIITNVFKGKVLVDEVRGRRAEIHTMQTLDCKMAQSVFKHYVTCARELGGLVQTNDRRAHMVQQHLSKNFKYLLYLKERARPSVSVHVYNNPDRNLVVRAAHADEAALEKTHMFMAKLILYCFDKYSVDIRRTLESKFRINIETQYARVTKDVKYAWYIPVGLSDFKQYSRIVWGYERRCQKKQPLVVERSLVDAATLDKLRREKFGKLRVSGDVRNVMYFKTADNREYILYCKPPSSPRHVYPVLVVMSGTYINDKYPVMPCCAADYSPETQRRLHDAYDKYLNNEIDLDALHKAFGVAVSETRVEYQKDSMMKCSKNQTGKVVEMVDVHDILKFVFKRADMARYGVVNPNDKAEALKSIINAAHYAINKTNIKSDEMAAAIDYVRDHIHLCAQEFESLESIDEYARELQTTVDHKARRALEAMYNTDIFIIEYDENDGRFFQSTAYGCNFELDPPAAPRDSCIILIKNHGKEFSRTTHAVYEPLYIGIGRLSNLTFKHDAHVRNALRHIMTQLYAAPAGLRMSAPTSFIQYVKNPVPPNYSVINQSYDLYNKVRYFELKHKSGRTLRAHADPLPSLTHLHRAPTVKELAADNPKDTIVQYIQDLNAMHANSPDLVTVTQYENGYGIHLGAPGTFGYNLYCKVGPAAAAEIGVIPPPLNAKRTEFDLYCVARDVVRAAKDNMLMAIIKYENEVGEAARTLRPTDDLAALIADASSKKASALVPKIKNIDYVIEYFMELFIRTGESSKAYTPGYKPHRYEGKMRDTYKWIQ